MKKERFGVAVEPGTVAKLRTLAGGQRKIGEFLTYVVDREWDLRNAIADGAPLEVEEAAPNLAELKERIRDLEERVRNQDTEIQEQDKIIVEMAQRAARHNRTLSYFYAVIGSAQTLKVYSFDEYIARRKSRPNQD